MLTADGVAQCSIAAAREADEAALEVVDNVQIHRFLPQEPRWKWVRKLRKQDSEHGNLELPGLELFLRKNKFDLVHFMCMGKLCNKLAGIVHERNIPYVVSCRSEDFQVFDAVRISGTDSIRARFMRVYREFQDALKNAARVFCSDHRLRRLLAHELGDRSLVYWQSGVEVERFSRPVSVDFRQFYQLSMSRPIVLSVGRLSDSKNQQLLLETVSVLNKRNWNCQLVVIGWCSSVDYLNKFRSLAAERNLEHCLTLIEGLPPGDERFQAAFQAASLVLLPSRYDVSGSAVLEAWAAGVPVIASPVGGGGDLIEDGVNGRLAAPQDFTAFVRCCEELLDERNRALLEKMRSSGFARCRELRWENRLAELIKIYNDILQINNE